MTPRIRRLPQHVATQIAAGEVVDRPGGVVRELLDNAIDAGATRIDIDLEAGGVDLIRVSDDGHGIHSDDLLLALAPHATSKIATADELFAVRTLGFRGEALASVGGVAKVLLQSRPPDQPTGAEVRCDGGDLSDVRPWGGAAGTRIEVRHLFFNVPARKKFLKNAATELGHATEALTRAALAHPGLHLTLRHNGKLVYDIPAATGLADRIGLFFGGDVRKALYDLDSGPGPVGLTGFVADPACDRGNSKWQYLFVNGRWFRDRSLGYALTDAYRGLIMTGRHPVGFLFLRVPPDQVDVNVHPTKAEVRFRDNSLVFSLVRSVAKARLAKENLIPRLEVPPPEAASPRQYLAERATAPWEPSEASGGRQPPVEAQETLLESATAGFRPPLAADATLAADIAIPPGTALQIHDAYLVLETPKGMLVIDQHALHERILYEQLRRRVREGKLDVQRLLIPEPIDLPAAQVAAVLEAKDDLAALGLDVADFGGNTVLLSSYPALLNRRPPHEILRAVVDHLVTNDRPPAKEALLDHLIATMACKAAVKAGDRLTPDEIAHLLHLRQLADDSHHCPHGRPTSLLFSRHDLNRQFRRI